MMAEHLLSSLQASNSTGHVVLVILDEEEAAFAKSTPPGPDRNIHDAAATKTTQRVLLAVTRLPACFTVIVRVLARIERKIYIVIYKKMAVKRYDRPIQYKHNSILRISTPSHIEIPLPPIDIYIRGKSAHGIISARLLRVEVHWFGSRLRTLYFVEHDDLLHLSRGKCTAWVGKVR